MRSLYVAALAVLALAPPAAAQDATQDVRVAAVSNDATAGGSLTVAIQVRTSAARAPNTSLGSATFDLVYDAAHLAPTAFTRPVNDADGYTAAFSAVTCGAEPCLRLTVTSAGIGDGLFESPGFDVGTDWVTLATLTFRLDATSAVATSLTVYRPTLSVGYYDSRDNASGNAVIEDNTGAVGDDVVAVAHVGDLAVRTATYGSASWYIVGAPGTGATVADLVGPLWTQGFPGSDAGEQGVASVVFWDETAGAYVTPTSPADALAPGVGMALYAFPDDDFDGADDPFPKTATVAVEPVDDAGAPVNNVAPDPYVPDLPFAFPMTYTTGTGVPEGSGWNLLANPSDGTADWDAAGWTRTDVSASFVTWDPGHPGGPQYVSWVAGVGGTRDDGVLDPFEGFWAVATGPAPSLVMPAAAYAPVADPRGAAVPAVRLAVAGTVGGEALATETLVAFAPGADAGLDGLDARELAGLTRARLHLFTRAEGADLDVDVRPPLAEGAAEVAVDVAASVDGAPEAVDLVLTWPELSGLPDGVPVQLLDAASNTIVDLRTATSYAFRLAGAESRQAGDSAAGDRVPVPGTPGALLGERGETARHPGGSRFVLFVGTVARPVATDPAGGDREAAFALAPPAPNPTRGAARVRFGLDAAGPARLAVYDVLGREVAALAGGARGAGMHEAALPAGTLAPGVYVVRLEAGGRVLTRSLTVVR